MSAPEQDQIVKQLREQISDVDRAIVDGINKRLKLVEQLWRYKESRGIPVLAPDREEWMVTYLTRANRGPLSEDGLRAIYAEVLALTKRELGSGA
ncbi:MAG TPA: chorismate mutase [Gaiellaceae bacterium]|jgi:chorismate mutase/prephenate dehydratase